MIDEKNGFKQTDIGFIPQDWEVMRIVELCDFERGTEPGSKSYNREGKGIPFIRVGNISAQIQELVYTTSKKVKICSEDDILISLDGSPGVVVRGIKGAYASGIRKVILKSSQAEKGFIYYVLQTPYVQKVIEKYTTGVTIKHASKSLPHIQIPLPPLPEQQKIAKVLDKIQQAIELQDRIIEQTKNLKKSLMQKLFTEGLYGEEQKETEIGLIPKSWEVVRLGEIFNIFAGGDISKLNWSPIKIGKFIYPIYSNSLENNGLYGFADIYNFPEGSITVTARGNLGHAIPRYEKFNAIIRLLVLIPKIKVDIKFFAEAINTYVKVNFEGASIPQLTRPKIANYVVPFPLLEEQKQIALILSTVDRKIEIEQRKKEVFKELFKTMLHKLMSGELRLNEVEI